MIDKELNSPRRSALARAVAAVLLLFGGRHAVSGPRADKPDPAQKRWYEAAAGMKRLAESWGDQPYGAVLVLEGRVVGDGPSRVVQRGDANAHAEREAIRDAQRRLGRQQLPGSVLYSTSHPCRLCEAAAASAQVSRLIYGEALADAGPPRP